MQPIDVVVPWVNSDDEKWLNKKEKYVDCDASD